MHRGNLVQVGTPLDIYYRPVNIWTSRFVGTHPINLFDIAIASDRPVVHPADRPDVPMPIDADLHGRLRAAAPDGTAVVGIRPEFVKLSAVNGSNGVAWKGEVFTRQVLGTSTLYDVRSANDHVTSVSDSEDQFGVGTNVGMELQWSRAFFFDKQTEQPLAL
jgi:multiple sugar transport system ATP-binding protein